MAGTSKAYNADKIVLGPSDLWINVALPGAGARLTVAADLTPDATANPNAIHLGMTAAGSTFTYKPEIQNMGSDELTSFHISRIITEAVTLKGNFLQVFDWNILEKMTVGVSAELESLKVEASVKDASIASLTEALKATEGELATFKALVAELEAGKVSASKEAAKIVASVGVTPVELSPADSKPTAEAVDHLAVFMALPVGSKERNEYFAANRHAIIKAAI